ncbi:MAG TPA: hypothetical protein VGI39_26575 [Polyangiaceae bacterium]
MNRILFALPFAAAVAVAIAGGCDNSAQVAPVCHDIPANGCPLEPDACQDPTCAATYTCNSDGTWSFAAKCNGFNPDAGHPQPLDAGVQGFDASGFDVPPGAYGGPGCDQNDLTEPDCTVSVGLACESSGGKDPCCGCETLFTCADGGWNVWGECFADGGIVETPN